MEAVKLALERADRSLADGRIPISGAAVERTSNGQLQVVTVGCLVANHLRFLCVENLGFLVVIPSNFVQVIFVL